MKLIELNSGAVSDVPLVAIKFHVINCWIQQNLDFIFYMYKILVQKRRDCFLTNNINYNCSFAKLHIF